MLNTGVVDGKVGRADEEEVSLYIENLDINRHREIVIMQHRGRSKRLSRTEVYKLRCRIGGSVCTGFPHTRGFCRARCL